MIAILLGLLRGWGGGMSSRVWLKVLYGVLIAVLDRGGGWEV